MKMLNLTHDWLNSLLPFCLMKIDRVIRHSFTNSVPTRVVFSPCSF
jgi:hypothetical protein